MNRQGRHARWPLLIGLLFLLALIPFALFRSSQVPEAEAAWWNPSWRYRKRIDVSNPNATDLTDFQISFSLDTATLITNSKLQNNCQDIRVTNHRGNELPFWIETAANKCNTTSTKIWVKAPSIPSAGAMLYVYYGNSTVAASTNHDGKKVFEYFEGFESYPNGSNINGQGSWSVTTGTWSITSDPGNANNQVLSANTGGNVWWQQAIQDNSFSTHNNVFIESDFYIDGAYNKYSADPLMWIGFRNTSATTYLAPGWGGWSKYHVIAAKPTAQYATEGAIASIPTSQWIPYKISAAGNVVTSYLVQGGTITYNSSAQTTGTFLTIDVRAFKGFWDNFRSRKYVSTEPTANLATEETTPGPVAYWKFDEGSGQTINDSGGGGIGGVLGRTSSLEASYDPQWQSADNCISGSCLYFDGIDDKVAIAKSSTVEPDFITISAWIKTSNTTSNQKFFSHDQANPYQSLLVTSDGRVRVEIDGISAGMTTKYGSRIVNDGKWHYVAVTYDGSLVRLYVDGQVDLSASYNGGVLQYGSAPWAFGVWGNTGEDFTGFIDEPKIFPYALTEDQIKTEYNLGAATIIGTGPTVAPPANGTLSNSLVAHWAFDEQYGQTAHDKVGNNHGTFGASTSPGSDDPSWKSAGECKVNGCLRFDGGDKVITTDSSDVRMNQDKSMSFSAWIKPNTVLGYDNIIRYDDYDNTDGDSLSPRNLYLFRIDSGNPKFIFGPTSGLTTIVSNTTLSTGNWYHLVATRDVATDIASIYLNGNLVGSGPDTTTGTWETTGQYPVIGALQNEFFDGLIDEVKIYNTALTADQVKQDMNAGASVAYSVGSEEADELADGAGAPPIAEWKFNEKQGTVAYDSSGRANDGTVSGATWKSGCQQGACLEFNGSSYVDIGKKGSIPGNVTVSAWIKTDTTSAGGIVAKYSNFGTWTYRLYMNSNGQAVFYRGNENDWSNSVTSSVSINNGEWHYVTGAFDGTNMIIYIDSVRTGSIPETRVSSSANIWNLCIGSDNYNCYSSHGVGKFTGQIDHVRIYDYARTPAQIAYDYNRGAPVAHWKFDECEGTVAHDSSGNENHGTITIGASGTQTTAGTCQTSGAWANGESGKFEGSLRFDGFDDVVTVTDTTNSQFDSSLLSIAFWVKAGAYDGAYEGIMSKASRNNSYIGPWTIMRSDAAFRFSINDGNTLSAPADYVNNWTHVVFTYDGNLIKGYINGTFSAQQSYSGGITPTNDSIMIGVGYSLANNRYLNGQIDDVRIYNYALSPAQIMKVYNQGYGVRYAPSN